MAKLIDVDAEIEKRESEIAEYERRKKEYVDMKEPDNIRIIHRINLCDANMKDLRNEILLLKSLEAVAATQTAYDVDKVVQRLEEEGKKCARRYVVGLENGVLNERTSGEACAFKEAADIVRKGGVE